LSNDHIDQFVEVVSPYQVQPFLKLCIQATVETISFMGISVRMITRVLTQVIESLCILHDSAGSLGQSQEFIELLLNVSFWNVVRSESGPEFVPCDDMTSWLHGIIMVPPYAGGAAELLSHEECHVHV
jgi:hypothetical protein